MKINKTFSLGNLQIISICVFALVATGNSYGADVTQRAAIKSTRVTNSQRNSIAGARAAGTQTTDTTVVTPEVVVTEEPVINEPVIENKSSQFDTVLEKSGGSDNSDISSADRADMIRAQRAMLDSADTKTTAAAVIASGKNACDTSLRDCMKQKCDNDFSKCDGDGDTIFGDKLESCKRNTTCDGEQFTMFAKEIKADRDNNSLLSSYNQVIDCGTQYNICIVNQCGTKFEKCLSKSAGDAAIAKCDTIAKKCQTADSGFAARTMQVFGTMRVSAEEQVKKDEKELYALRDQMASQCKKLGAMFDERSLDCVYTVNFFADGSKSPMSSQKVYAGSTYDCTQNWFGIDVTTFKENAYRLTRSQTAASSAMMGSGLGTAAGAISSGAIGRAMDTAKAKGALDKAKDALGSKQETSESGDKPSLLDKAKGLLNKKSEDTNDNKVETKKDLTDQGKPQGNINNLVETANVNKVAAETPAQTAPTIKATLPGTTNNTNNSGDFNFTTAGTGAK